MTIDTRASDITLGRIETIIREVDAHLDADVAGTYKDQPLAQDWGRVAKVAEECGEAVDALIRLTGQNPRKGTCGTLDELIGELADVAMTGIFAIQHFTKDERRTVAVLMAAMEKAHSRLVAAK